MVCTPKSEVEYFALYTLYVSSFIYSYILNNIHNTTGIRIMHYECIMHASKMCDTCSRFFAYVPIHVSICIYSRSHVFCVSRHDNIRYMPTCMLTVNGTFRAAARFCSARRCPRPCGPRKGKWALCSSRRRGGVFPSCVMYLSSTGRIRCKGDGRYISNTPGYVPHRHH